MTTDNTTPLAPCPFCGKSKGYLASNGVYNCFVECERCGASGPVCASEAQAIAVWNRRALAAQPAPSYGSALTDQQVREYAARYQWLRNVAHPDRDDTGLACIERDVTDWGRHCNKHVSGYSLDAAIDAARASSTGETTTSTPKEN